MKSEFPPNSTIILVHAAWAGGSCWSNVILPLQQRGLHVICAPIPMTTLSMEAIVRPQGWDHWDIMNMRPAKEVSGNGRHELGETKAIA